MSMDNFTYLAFCSKLSQGIFLLATVATEQKDFKIIILKILI